MARAAAARDELTDTAADAAIEQACKILRLPTIRERHGEVAAAASRQQRADLAGAAAAARAGAIRAELACRVSRSPRVLVMITGATTA